MFDETPEQEHARHMRGRAAMPGLIGAHARVSKAAVAICCSMAVGMAAVCIYAVRVIASVRQEKTAGYVVLLDRQTGERIQAPSVEADEFRASSQMVAHHLGEIVTCMRGLERGPTPDASEALVRRCWNEVKPLFDRSASAAFFGDQFRKQFPNGIARRIAAETVDLDDIDAHRPNPQDKPGLYWITWSEKHVAKNGSTRPEVQRWSAEFDMEVGEVEAVGVGPGLHVRTAKWQRVEGDG